MLLTKLVRMSLVAALAAVAVFGSSQTVPAKETKAASNTVAVCGCGKVFIPDASTLYLTVGDKQYACCSKACHDMAAKDPAGAAAMAEKATSTALAQLSQVKVDVANVIAVTDKGTKALCGCGKQFTIDEDTEYIKFGGKSYACCTHECHEMASKDPAAAVKSFEEQLAKSK
jgi:CDGSH-type Zn-finger protein